MTSSVIQITTRKLLVQVKHSVSAVKSNKDFVETVQAAWRDFNSESFDTNCDRIALVTANISPKNRTAIAKLNTQAWSSSDAADFTDTRIYQSRFISTATKEIFETIRDLITRSRIREKNQTQILCGCFSRRFRADIRP